MVASGFDEQGFKEMLSWAQEKEQSEKVEMNCLSAHECLNYATDHEYRKNKCSL